MSGASSGGPAVVRPATPDDAPAVARLLATALAAKYRPAFGARAEDALVTLVGRGAPGVSRVLVAERDGVVVGAVRLALRREHDAGLADRLVRQIGWLRAMRAFAVLSTIADRGITADEAWVEELAVAPEARRRGVARLLLDRCEREARELGRRRLTLWVTGENTGAIALYRSSGFAVRSRRRWPLGRLLFRAAGALRMEKPLRV
ncbi:MAG: GNAT family N-acetyltransferase [Actinomycetota bacterium]